MTEQLKSGVSRPVYRLMLQSPDRVLSFWGYHEKLWGEKCSEFLKRIKFEVYIVHRILPKRVLVDVILISLWILQHA